jgi:putative tricarboxylic transport membrane protein
MKGKDKGEFIIPIIILILSFFLYEDTYTFKFTTYQKASPQMWPRLILTLLILTSLGLIAKLLLSKPPQNTEEKNQIPKTGWGIMLAGILILFLYIFLMEYLGYIISTLLFTFCAMVMLGNRNKLQLFSVPVVITAFIFLLFTYAMYVPLPKGVGIFRDFSLMFQ